MAVIWDNNILVHLFRPDERDIKKQKQVKALYQQLQNQKEIIFIPTPVLAEFLIGTKGKTEKVLLLAELKRLKFHTLPFCEDASIICAHLPEQLAHQPNEQVINYPRQKVKIDRQIIAIALFNEISAVYSQDKQLISVAQSLGLNAISLE